MFINGIGQIIKIPWKKLLKSIKQEFWVKNQKQCYIVSYESKPVGYIQKYKIKDYPENAQYVKSEDQASGVDLFIGEPNFIGRGLVSMMLKKFLKEIIFTQEGIDTCVIDPQPDNARAIRAYEKVGFKFVRVLQKPKKRNPTYLMRLKKEEFTKNSD